MKNFFILKCLGFDNINDYLSTIFITKYKILTFFSILFGAFQMNYLWRDKNEIIFLWILLICDLLTGVFKSIKLKTFTSSKLPRWAGISFTYTLLLMLSHNMAKYSVVFEFLPGALYTLFCAVLFVSLVENLNAVGFLNIKVYEYIKEKFNTIFSSNKEK